MTNSANKLKQNSHTLILNNFKEEAIKVMAQHEAQRVTTSLLGDFDQRIWETLALKVIEKMPRSVNTKEIAQNLSEFVFFNSKIQQKEQNLSEENTQSKSRSFQSHMMGNANLLKRERLSTQITHSQLISNMIDKKFKKMTSKLLTEGAEPVSTIQTNYTLPLFMSEISNEQETRKDDLFRISKNEQLKFNQRQQYQSRQRRIVSQQRLMAQHKKFKEVKRFTYDYEGKILNVAAQNKSQNLKVFNIKSFFKSNLSQHRQKQYKQKAIDISRVATVSTKKVVAMEHRREEDDNLHGSWMKLGKTSPVNFIQMFKGDQKVQMGVSITDIMQNSTISGGKRRKIGNEGMKRSDYKQKNSSSFKPRVRTEEAIRDRISSEGKTKQTPAIFKQKVELQKESQAQSKCLSSSFSFTGKKMGKISKNQPLYQENFKS